MVARNIWYNKLKRANLLETTDISDHDVEDKSDGSLSMLISEERTTAINKLLGVAGDRCKELLKLILFENKRMKEIVELMQFSSEEVAKTNHYRCKQKLKDALKQDIHLLEALR